MPRFLFRVSLFLSSYAPLLGLLAYTNRDSCTVAAILVIVAVVAVAGLGVVLLVLRQSRGPVLRVAHSKPQDGEVLAYIATYLVPFLGVDLSQSDGIVLFGGFLIVLGVVYINSNMLFVNPLLSSIGFHWFEVTDPSGHQYSVISRRRDLTPGEQIRPAQVDRYVRVEVRRDRS